MNEEFDNNEIQNNADEQNNTAAAEETADVVSNTENTEETNQPETVPEEETKSEEPAESADTAEPAEPAAQETVNVQTPVNNAETYTATIQNPLNAGNTQNAQNSQNSTQQSGQQVSNNPYFSGYGSYNAYRSPYARNENGQQNNSMSQNGVNAGGQYTQGQNPQNNAFSYNQNRQQNQNGYNAYNTTRGAGQNTDGISYAPVKKKKAKKGVSGGVIAATVICSLILGLAGGIGGAKLVFGNTSKQERQTAVSASEPEVKQAVEEKNDTVVIYRSVAEDVPTSTSETEGGDLTYAQVASMVKDSVVEINTEYKVVSAWYQYTTGGAGSGVIISADGYIITNNHVIVDSTETSVADKITVRLTDGSEYKAEVIGRDADADIAIIKIDAKDLCAAQCGDSSKLVVGEELMVVGNPLGELGGTVTNGIVSATEREINVGGVEMTLIQTNAAVNPGNSGGGMFNMKGELVGVVNAKSSGSGIEGLGFAIPINDALEVSEQLLEYGYVRGKPMIGVTFQDVGSNNFFYFSTMKAGVYVYNLVEGYNDKVLAVGDRIIAVDGEEVTSSAEIKTLVMKHEVGDKIEFQFYRDNKLMSAEVEVFERVPDSTSSIQFSD